MQFEVILDRFTSKHGSKLCESWFYRFLNNTRLNFLKLGNKGRNFCFEIFDECLSFIDKIIILLKHRERCVAIRFSNFSVPFFPIAVLQNSRSI